MKIDTLMNANDEAALTAAIDSLHRRAGTLQMDIHKILVCIALRWERTGDVRPVVAHVNRLLAKDQMQGVRKNAIRAWVETFLHLTFAEDGDSKGQFIAGKAKAKDLDVKKLTNTRWFEFKPEPDYKPLDPMAALTGMIRKFETDRAKMGEESKVDPAMIEALKALKVGEIAH